MSTNKDLVTEYFARLSKGDLNGVLDLFADDASVYEPFSSKNVLHGISEIEPFVKVAMMATEGLQREITFSPQKKDKIVANVKFKRGSDVTGRFTFGIKDLADKSGGYKKIKSLKIEFLE
ncbi:nuclear transport factor 2 family protein [Candidatus Nitrososphaera sp. FF02]|uniref:nuclear transport factor 2 family protein n=1 Tax=Candidatus Nitrososphaera sp. FF02 TaxID=3398226 RepID=UPI0039EA19E9